MHLFSNGGGGGGGHSSITLKAQHTCKSFLGGAYLCSPNKSSRWPSECLMTCTLSSASDLLHNHYLQNVG